jgi:methylthioribose-1-phosphate isomerase
MNINGQPARTIWPRVDGNVEIIDQTALPHRLETRLLTTLAEAAEAIFVMRVRGAPLIGATAAYGMALAMRADASDAGLFAAAATLIATRPTAVNLRWAVERMQRVLQPVPVAERAARAWAEAALTCEEDVSLNAAIGQHGVAILQGLARPGQPLRVMTHCNAGWLATVDWGTALAPVYAAQSAGIPLFVWASETRPRNQGASLTAWELGQQGIGHAVIVDNAAGLLMRRGEVDVVIVGADRVAANGDVANKIGTYLKALAAFDNGIPFYVAVPSPTIDWRCPEGAQIPIEERDAAEVTHVLGALDDAVGGVLPCATQTVRVVPAGATAVNPAFDVTPARLVTGIITERGIAAPDALAGLFPDLLTARP